VEQNTNYPSAFLLTISSADEHNISSS